MTSTNNRYCSTPSAVFLASGLALLLSLTLGTAEGATAEPAPSPLSVRVYPEHAVQRVGETEIVSVRLELPEAPDGDARVTLLPPPGVAVLGPRTQVTGEWTRGWVYANTVNDYFTYRRVPEMRVSTTLSWSVRSPRPLQAAGQVRVNAPGREPIDLPVHFNLQPKPAVPADGSIPPPVPAAHDDLVGALYYPGWTPGTGSGWSLMEPYPERKPALGFYDESSPEVSDWEIKWALENGINFFAYCWYRLPGDTMVPGEQFLEQGLSEGLLKSRFLDQFKFSLMWCADPGSPTEFNFLQQTVPYWIEHHFTHPSYLIVDNKPVLFIYGIEPMIQSFGSMEVARKAMDGLRQQVKDAGFDGIYLLGEERGNMAEKLENIRLLGFDGVFPYAFPAPRPMEGEEAVRAILQKHREQRALSPLPVVPVGTVSWDPQPWVEYIDYAWHNTVFTLEPEPYRTLLQGLRDERDRHPTGDPLLDRLFLIDNWNEWAEGHWVSPSRRRGFEHLHAVREVFAPDAEPQPDLIPQDLGREPDESAYLTWLEQMKQEHGE